MQPSLRCHLCWYTTEWPDDSNWSLHVDAKLSTVWVTNKQQLVDWAIEAVEDNGLERVQCPGRPGIHGGEQVPWYGLGNMARRLGVPGSSTMGTMSAYWSSKARVDYFDADHFVDQVATMSQICGRLMLAELETIESVDRESSG